MRCVRRSTNPRKRDPYMNRREWLSFDPEGGVGSSFSDVFTVEPTGPSLQMSLLPWSKERMWIEI
jgi:hypothetical protein